MVRGERRPRVEGVVTMIKGIIAGIAAAAAAGALALGCAGEPSGALSQGASGMPIQPMRIVRPDSSTKDCGA